MPAAREEEEEGQGAPVRVRGAPCVTVIGGAVGERVISMGAFIETEVVAGAQRCGVCRATATQRARALTG